LLPVASVVSPRVAAASTSCGNGVVDAGEQCDSGSALGSPECNTACQRTAFEPAGLPFGVPMSTLSSDFGNLAEIFSPGLDCKPASVRDGARDLEPVHVKYRIHLCRTPLGVDSFTPEQVRAAMKRASDEYALGGVILEEESLVRFSDKDCLVSADDSTWSDALVANTPPGVLAVSFVTGISMASSQFAVGGYCYFFGPICVNAGAYDTLVVHELGHFFGLAHTFECEYGSETRAACSSTGDFLCDTPPDRGPAGVSGIAQCANGSLLDGSCSGTCGHKVCTDGSVPDSFDWMGYYHCTPGHFTDQQRDFMRCTLDHEMRPYNANTFVAPTTTLPQTTTTTTPETTSTTMADETSCGDVNDDGVITAADALGVLRAGVGLFGCAVWQCDYDGSGIISASDALEVLKAAIGAGASADCPARY